ncbi:Protein tas [Chlorella vulgaris]
MAFKLWIGNLPEGIPDKDVEDAFSKFGRMKSCWVARKPPGFAFVEYDDKRDAEDAVRGLDGSNGWRVEFARASGPKAKGSYAGGRGRDEDRADGRAYGGGAGGRRSPAGSPLPRMRRSPSYERGPQRAISPSGPRRGSRSPPPRARRSPSYERAPRRVASPRRGRSPPSHVRRISSHNRAPLRLASPRGQRRRSRSPPPRRPSPLHRRRSRSPPPRRASPLQRRRSRSPPPRRASPLQRRRSRSPPPRRASPPPRRASLPRGGRSRSPAPRRQQSDSPPGTMTWGCQNTEEEAFEQLDYALSKGVNFIDTAELYPVPPTAEMCGRTEEFIGRWMAARGCRDKVVLASKVMGGAKDGRNFVPANRFVPPAADAPAPRLEPAQIRAAVDGSLRRLQTDRLDLLQLHWPDRYAAVFGKNQYRADAHYDPVPFEEQVAAVGELIKEGKVRHWGLSNETTYGVCRLCEVAARLGVPPPISIQNDFSLLDRRFEGELAEACAPHHYNLGLLPYGPLAGGTLTNKYFGDGKPGPNARHFPDFQARYHCDRSMAAAAEYCSLAKSKGLSLAQLALAWCKSRWFVASVIIGATSLEQLKENIAAFELNLDEETLAAVDALHLKHRNPNVTD